MRLFAIDMHDNTIQSQINAFSAHIYLALCAICLIISLSRTLNTTVGPIMDSDSRVGLKEFSEV
jgi:hypothetical protein